MPKDSEMRTTNFTVNRELWIQFRMLCLKLKTTVKARLALLVERDVKKNLKD